jgi:protein CpxP
MSIKRKFFSVITLAVAMFAFSTFISAQDSSKSDAPTPPVKEGKYGKRGFGEGRRGGDRGMHGGNIMRSLRGIELTDAQKTQIKSLMETNKTTFQPQREEMRSLMMKKRDGSISESEKGRFDQLKNEMKASAQQMEISIMALLTPEQTAKVTQMKAEREQKMQERKQQRQERKQQGDTPKDN